MGDGFPLLRGNDTFTNKNHLLKVIFVSIDKLLGGDDSGVFGHFQSAIETDTFALREFDFAWSGGKQRVILAFSNIFTRVNTGAALADDNHAGFDGLAVMDFDAEAFGL